MKIIVTSIRLSRQSPIANRQSPLALAVPNRADMWMPRCCCPFHYFSHQPGYLYVPHSSQAASRKPIDQLPSSTTTALRLEEENIPSNWQLCVSLTTDPTTPLTPAPISYWVELNLGFGGLTDWIVLNHRQRSVRSGSYKGLEVARHRHRDQAHGNRARFGCRSISLCFILLKEYKEGRTFFCHQWCSVMMSGVTNEVGVSFSGTGLPGPPTQYPKPCTWENKKQKLQSADTGQAWRLVGVPNYG